MINKIGYGLAIVVVIIGMIMFVEAFPLVAIAFPLIAIAFILFLLFLK